MFKPGINSKLVTHLKVRIDNNKKVFNNSL